MDDAGAPTGTTWSVGIVNHGSFDDLERCLAAVAAQSRPPRRVAVWDTGADATAIARLASAHPEVTFEGGTNEGYAGGANRVIRALVEGPEAVPPDFVLVLNPDVELDADFAAVLLAAIEGEADVAIATGKLLRPDRRTLDSAGIVFPRHRRPRDRGSEAPDDGRFDVAEDVDAASGAALLLRTAAIDRLALDGELFDESFFAYHEDTDLGWRARRLGYRVRYVPRAMAVHARGWKKSERKRVPLAIRRHSFKNHYLQVVKNETRADLLRNAPWLLGWEILRLGFTLLRDPGLLPAYAHAARALPDALRKRRLVAARACEDPGPG
ncbi:MAG: glycosyltransferase family 2 protein [Myxococcota bacterium]